MLQEGLTGRGRHSILLDFQHQGKLQVQVRPEALSPRLISWKGLAGTVRAMRCLTCTKTILLSAGCIGVHVHDLVDGWLSRPWVPRCQGMETVQTARFLDVCPQPLDVCRGCDQRISHEPALWDALQHSQAEEKLLGGHCGGKEV